MRPRPVKRLSISSIQAWESCPMLWYGRTIARWPKSPSQAMEMGTVIHDAMAKHHAGADAERIITSAWAGLKALGLPGDSCTRSIYALDQYARMNPRTPNDRSEVWFSTTLRGVPVPFVGVFDLVRPTHIEEFKTSRALWNQKRVDSEVQADGYWLAFKQVIGVRPEVMVYWVLASASGVPQLQRFETTRTDADMLRFIHRARQAYDGMGTGELIRRCRGGRCEWPERCADFAERGYPG